VGLADSLSADRSARDLADRLDRFPLGLVGFANGIITTPAVLA
jgi:hypothetical protein